MRYLVLLGFVIASLGCSSEPSTELMGAEFDSISECLSSIQRKTGEVLDPITDKPNHVSGFLGKTGLQFNCEVMKTGTKGTYVDGWYQVKKDK